MDRNISKPIFIIGIPRSGTTLLYSLIAQNDDVGYFTKKTQLELMDESFLRFIFLRRRIFEMRGYPYPMMSFNYNSFNTADPPMELGFLYDMAFPGHWNGTISEKYLSILKLKMSESINRFKAKRFLSKTPMNSLRIELIKKAFPDCKFIHIFRNPVAVVNSLLKRSIESPSGYIGIPLKESTSGVSPVQKHALQWKQGIEDIKEKSKSLPSEQFMEIKYEEFVIDPQTKLKEITEFCEMPHFDYTYELEGKLINPGKKQHAKNRSLPIQIIENKNKKYENTDEIIAVVNSVSRDMGYQ